MDNNEILLNQLAEGQAKLEKKIRELEKQANSNSMQTAEDAKYAQDFLVIKTAVNQLHSRLKIVEEKRIQNPESQFHEPIKTSTDVRRVIWKIGQIIFLGGFILYLWNLSAEVKRYEDGYYKYQSMDVLGLEKEVVDFHFDLNSDSLKSLVNDSLSAMRNREPNER